MTITFQKYTGSDKTIIAAAQNATSVIPSANRSFYDIDTVCGPESPHLTYGVKLGGGKKIDIIVEYDDSGECREIRPKPGYVDEKAVKELRRGGLSGWLCSLDINWNMHVWIYPGKGQQVCLGEVCKKHSVFWSGVTISRKSYLRNSPFECMVSKLKEPFSVKVGDFNKDGLTDFALGAEIYLQL